MGKSKSGKKRNKVDPILKMAKQNSDASLARILCERNDRTIEKNKHDDQQRARKQFQDDLETQRLFNEMKRRDF